MEKEECIHPIEALTTVYSYDDYEKTGKGYYCQCLDCWKTFPLAESKKIAREKAIALL